MSANLDDEKERPGRVYTIGIGPGEIQDREQDQDEEQKQSECSNKTGSRLNQNDTVHAQAIRGAVLLNTLTRG